MNRQEKLVLLVVALLVLSHLGGIARELVVAYHYGTGPIPPADRRALREISVILSGFVNFGAALWLFVEARAFALKSWVWALFGLSFGLLGVALFYLVQLHGGQRPQRA